MARKLHAIAIGCGVAVACLFGILLVLILGIGLAVETGQIPDTDALPAGKIPANQLRQLEEMGVTRKGEKVLFFYSAALLDLRGDGNLFTDERVISYQEADGVVEISDATYDKIASIQFLSGTWLDDSTITVTKDDGSWFVLYVSTGSQGDMLFYNKLMQEWRKHRPKVEGPEPGKQEP